MITHLLNNHSLKIENSVLATESLERTQDELLKTRIETTKAFFYTHVNSKILVTRKEIDCMFTR